MSYRQQTDGTDLLLEKMADEELFSILDHLFEHPKIDPVHLARVMREIYARSLLNAYVLRTKANPIEGG